MTKYYVKWQLNPNIFVEDPGKRAKLWLQMLDMVKADMKSGAIKEWGNCCDGSGGYTIMEAKNEEELFAITMKWVPYVNFDARPFVTVDETINGIKKLAAP
jgi:citrate lyase alpha subunit